MMMQKFTIFLLVHLLLLNLNFALYLGTSSSDLVKKIEIRRGVTGDYLGVSVKSAGDIDNDGYDDIIIGAASSNGGKGAVYIIYGGPTENLENPDLSSTTSLDPLTTGFMLTGEAAGGYFGQSVSGAGDINNDGYDDIVIGASNQNSLKGAAYVVYGGPKSSMTHIDLSTTPLNPSTTGFMIAGSTSTIFLGISVSNAGDINNDEYADIVIGAHGQGAAYVIYGGPKSSMPNIDLSTALDPHTNGFMIKGDALNIQFGQSVSGAGDINKDTFDDIVIGVPGRNNKGAAYVIYGGPKSSMSNIDLSSTSLDPLTTGFRITGGETGGSFGYSVKSAGDIDKDGYYDIIIGAMGKSSAYVIYGGETSSRANIDLSTTPLDPHATGFKITGGAGEMFGYSVSGAGDVNQDGYDDMIIGAIGKEASKGGVYVIYGGAKASRVDINLSNTLTAGFLITGSVASDQVGVSVGAADINNDGASDILIGAYGEDGSKGAAYAIMYYFCEENCLVCPSSLICSVCSPGYMPVGANCQPCPSNCETCSVVGACEACFDPYLLSGVKCVNNCPEKMFPSPNRECQNCPDKCFKCTDSSTCQECVEGYTLSGSNCKKIETETEEIEEKTGEKVAAGAFEGTTLIGAALGSGSSLPLNFGLVAKIIRNFKYMKLPVSQELYETFVSWKVASGFMSAPNSWSQKYSSKGLPTVFSRYKLQSAFLINFWKPLSMALIGIAIFGVFKSLEIVMKKNGEKENKMSKISRQVNVAASNFALTQFYSNLDDVIFYFILEMRSTDFETGFRVFSSLLAIMLLLAGGLFIGLHSKLTGKYQKLKEAGSSAQVKEFEYKYENISLIFKDFKDTNLLIQSFLMINVGRSVISSIIFASLFEYPMIQISFLFVLNILMLVYLWNKKSFKEFTNTCGQIFCEGILLVTNICVFLLALFDHADSYPITPIKNLGKCIIVLNFILLFGSALLLLISLGKMLYQSYLEKKKGQQQVLQPERKVLTSAKFNRPDLTHTDFVNTEQNTFVSDSYQQTPSLQVERNLSINHQETLSINYSTQSPIRNNKSPCLHSQMDTFETLNSSKIEDFADTSQSNVIPNQMLHRSRSRLMRNRQITQARIDEVSRMRANSTVKNHENRIQDSSFHSRMTLNQENSMDQDNYLITFDPSPPLRVDQNDLGPRKRAQTVKK